MANDLGDLKKLNVRRIWQNEASGFTPWLATEKNIECLGAAIGLELEVENTEVAVGPYSADILARDSGSSAYVVIENQLNKTDHDHLGKAITYAKRIGVRVYMRNKYNAEAALSQLLDQQAQIESEIGQSLLWNPNPDNIDKVIAAYHEANLTDRSQWPAYLDWMVNMTVTFRQSFGPRVKQLDLEADNEPEEDDHE